MKNIIFIVFFALILAGFTAFGQTSQLISHVDTLQSGDVIITLTDGQGNLINKGLAKPGFGFQNDTTDMIFPTGGSDENPDGAYVDNIALPGNDGGFLPQDVVFNPHNGNYYIYGFRKIMVCDANLQAIKTIDISNVDGFSTFYSDYHERRIFVHPTQNMVYGMTINGVLFSIDQYFNLQTLTEPIGNYLIERSSMIYMESDNTIWYYFYIETASTNKTLLYKYSINNAQLTNNEISGTISYDIDAINSEASYKILVSTNQGIKVFSSSLQLENPFFSSYKFDYIAVMDNLIFAHQTEPNNRLLVLNAAGSLIQELQLNYTNVRFAFPDTTNHKIYFSGYSSSSSGIDIVKQMGSQWAPQNCAHQNIFGLSEDSTQIIGCGKDSVIFINKQTGVHTSVSSTSIGQMYRVAPASSTNRAIAAQPLNGNVLKISSSGTQILETGGNISGVCRKGDKIYMAVNKFNDQGYILILNAYSGEIVGKVEPTFDFNPVDVFCLDDENVVNDRIYVIYVVPDGEFTKNKLMYFETGNPSQMTNSDIEFEDGFMEYLITPNGTICLGLKSPENICPGESRIYFYDYNLEGKYPYYYSAAQGCIKEFDYISGANFDYIVFVSSCNNTIYFFDDSQNNITLHDYCSQNNFHPFSFCYNSDNSLGYCFNQDESSTHLFTITMDDFDITEIEANYSFQQVHEMFYNTTDTYVYGISSETLYKIGDDAVLDEYDLDKTVDIHDNFNRKDDYIFDPDRNFLFLGITDDEGYINSKKVLKVDLSDGTNELYDPGLSYQKSIQVLYPTKVFHLFGKSLTYYADKQNIFSGQMYFSNSSLITTYTHSRTLTGDWDWISFPCLPRLGNNGYDSQTLLETIDPLEDYLELDTQSGGYELELIYDNPNWTTSPIPYITSTQGYKYYTNPIGNQSLVVTGVVLDPATPIQLSSSYENWIGYFLEEPLGPEDAFVGVWDKLTRISTHDWTMVKINGQWVGPSTITPIEFGDGLIVTVSEDCELIWNYASEPAERFEYTPTEYYSYEEKAEYTPFYFQMDSINDIKEIGLIVNDTCVGAAIVEPGDSIVEVNAYLTGTQSGLPIEVETWSGFKSVKLSPDKYSVVDPATRKRATRKVYTGEHKAYYILSFKSGETSEESPVALLQPASPNPFNSATQLSFVLNRQAKVSLTVYDLQGNTVKSLLRGNYPEGLYDAGWTGTDAYGKQAENGIYVIRLTVDDKIIKNEKVVLIK